MINKEYILQRVYIDGRGGFMDLQLMFNIVGVLMLLSPFIFGLMLVIILSIRQDI